jgi:hypothetical protein
MYSGVGDQSKLARWQALGLDQYFAKACSELDSESTSDKPKIRIRYFFWSDDEYKEEDPPFAQEAKVPWGV